MLELHSPVTLEFNDVLVKMIRPGVGASKEQPIQLWMKPEH